MPAARKPSRKRYGRPGPPPGYPKDRKVYADPENWKYPVHTPYHAKAARRYFNKQRNRQVYDPEEQLYMDSKINRALRRFGIEPASVTGTSADIVVRGKVEEKPPPDIQTASLDTCLRYLLGEPRFNRAKKMSDKDLTILQQDRRQLRAKIRTYAVSIDFRRKIITHNCADWRRRKTGKKLCKHIGKILLTMPERKAKSLLRDLIRDPDSWTLS